MITSTANPRVKDALRLRKRRERDRTGRFLVEGRRELSRALGAGVRVDEVLACRPLIGTDAAILDRAADAGAEIVEVAERVFGRLSLREGPDGVLGVARTFATGLDDLDAGAGAGAVVPVPPVPPVPLVLVVAGVEKPGNLGAMLRTASAAGATAVVVADPVTDVFNPQVVRASQGALFGVPVGVGDTPAAVAWLRRHGLRIYAAGPGATEPYWRLPLSGPSALVVGSEHRGLPPAWFAAADERVVIPMPGSGGVDSLNAAAAAAVLLFDAARQRAEG
ncbi:MAG TPA: RNA methyltransferase [Acidimicrobiales bacterium]|nr:RNA methyltransferase [Acidimicrobiales bacterium]